MHILSGTAMKLLLYAMTSHATSQLFNTNTVKTDYKQGFSGEKLWSYIFDLQESHFLEEK